MTVSRVAVLCAFFPLLALCLAGCGQPSERVRHEQVRELSAFHAISLKGAAQIEITVGAPQSVTVRGTSGALERLTTEVREGTLHVASKPGRWLMPGRGGRLSLQIAVPQLDSLRLEGGNDVRLSGYEGGTTRLEVLGATRLVASGRVDELVVHLAGAGDVDLAELAAGSVDVSVEGVGSVVVNPIERLNATMNGVGAILYTGTPAQIRTKMNGLGTIGQREPQDERAANEGVERLDDSAPRDTASTEII